MASTLSDQQKERPQHSSLSNHQYTLVIDPDITSPSTHTSDALHVPGPQTDWHDIPVVCCEWSGNKLSVHLFIAILALIAIGGFFVYLFQTAP